MHNSSEQRNGKTEYKRYCATLAIEYKYQSLRQTHFVEVDFAQDECLYQNRKEQGYHFFVFSAFAEKGNHVKYEGYDKYRSLCYFKTTASGYCPFGMVENCQRVPRISRTNCTLVLA